MTSASPNKFEWFPHKQLLNEFLSLGLSNPKQFLKLHFFSKLATFYTKVGKFEKSGIKVLRL